MRKPSDAYREGYEKAKRDAAGEVIAEVTMGMMRDDPGGHFAAGYHDGAGGKDFRPPSDHVRRSETDLNPFDNKEAVRLACPKCGEIDWFEWRFLGKLKDPVCGHEWYAATGLYTAKQFRAAFQLSRKFIKYYGYGNSSGQGAWIGNALGYFMGFVLGLAFRLPYGLLMIPIQAVVAHNYRKKGMPAEISRSVAAGSS